MRGILRFDMAGYPGPAFGRARGCRLPVANVARRLADERGGGRAGRGVRQGEERGGGAPFWEVVVDAAVASRVIGARLARAAGSGGAVRAVAGGYGQHHSTGRGGRRAGADGRRLRAHMSGRGIRPMSDRGQQEDLGCRYEGCCGQGKAGYPSGCLQEKCHSCHALTHGSTRSCTAGVSRSCGLARSGRQ